MGPEPHVDPDATPGAGPPAPFLSEQQRALRAVIVGVVLGAVLAALARRASR